ncbi:MAG: winged helix-turn-helix domain-containing protein [Thermoanaerobaculia bacterium]
MRPHGSPKELEARRQRARTLLGEGLTPREVAERLGVDRVSVYRWRADLKRVGPRAIRAKPASGRPPKMTTVQRTELECILLRGATAAGFPTDLWTCPRIAEVIREHFGITYHVDHIGRLLHSMGWSPQKPTRRAVERDNEAIRTWIRRDWSRIKKKPDGKTR